jgi:hypothetical protein
MLISGTWHVCDDGLIRPVIRTEVQAGDGSWIKAPLGRRPLHIQCSYPSCPLVKIITVYEPDLRRWVDFKVRRSTDEP